MVASGKTQSWEFNEWFHGRSGCPMGFGGQSWSAAMYLFAYDAVENAQIRVFNRAHGWIDDMQLTRKDERQQW